LCHLQGNGWEKRERKEPKIFNVELVLRWRNSGLVPPKAFSSLLSKMHKDNDRKDIPDLSQK
jgi:hypothetical protein